MPDAIQDEREILSQQGIEFIHLPIPFSAPQEAHVVAVSAALARLKDKKVLVHCQVNMRASTMVFLYRVVNGKEDPTLAYDAVTKVWSPEGPWRALLLAQMKKHNINFEPY